MQNGLAGMLRGVRASYAFFDHAVRSFLQARALEAGASIAYYAFFSLFPLLIFLISLLGFFMDPEQVNAYVLRLVQDVFPVSRERVADLIEQTLQSVVEQRAPMSLLAGFSLLWAGSNVFTVLLRNVNRAWGATSKPLSFLRTRLVAMAIIFGLASFIAISLLVTPLLNLLTRLEIGSITVHQTWVWWLLEETVPYALTFLLFFALYRWVPNTRVRPLEAAAGAALATVAWQATILGFTWMIREGILNYRLVYGSLTTIVIAMLWIYLSSLILFFCAHVCATVAHWRGRG